MILVTHAVAHSLREWQSRVVKNYINSQKIKQPGDSSTSECQSCFQRHSGFSGAVLSPDSDRWNRKAVRSSAAVHIFWITFLMFPLLYSCPFPFHMKKGSRSVCAALACCTSISPAGCIYFFFWTSSIACLPVICSISSFRRHNAFHDLEISFFLLSSVFS